MNKEKIYIKLKELHVLSKLVTILAITLLCTGIYVLASQEGVKGYGKLSMEDLDLPVFELQTIASAPELEGVSGYVAVEQTQSAILYVNTQTTGLALLDTNTGTVYFTQLPEETVAVAGASNTVLSGQMQSGFVLATANITTGTESVYSAYDHSIAFGNFALENIQGGVRIHYLVGRVPKERVVPQVLLTERFEEILAGLDAQDQREFRTRYREIDIDKITDSTEINELIDSYPILEEIPFIYVLRPQLQEFILDRLDKALREQGYGMEAKAADEAKIFLGDAKIELPDIYKLQIDFVLEDSKLVVALERSNILHTDTTVPLYIELLPYFFTSSINDDGYFLLPDGTGSVLNFNNQKTNTALYSAQVYGRNPVELPVITQEHTLTAHIPVFGMVKNDGTLLARITRGEADAVVFADISGKTSNMNVAYPRFTLREFKREVVYRDWKAGAGTVYANRVQPGELVGQIELEYHILDESRQGYAGMAGLYRDLLLKEGLLKKQDTVNNRLLLHILGSAQVVKSFAGIPVRVNEVMTTFEHAQEMAAYFRESSIETDIRYIGAANGGINQTIADKIRFLGSLGGKSGFDRLTRYIGEGQGAVFPELDLIFAQNNKLFDGFTKARDVTMNLSREKKASYDRDPVSFYYVLNPKFILTPQKVSEISTRLSNSLEKHNVSGISTGRLGSEIGSDFNPNNPISRPEAMGYYKNALHNLNNTDIKIMVTGTNVYTLEFADYIVNMPSSSNRFRITDGSVPFYQMVVFGSIPFSYSPINTDSNPEDLFLRSIATGANLSALFSWNDTSALKKSDYPMFYSANFESSKELMAGYYLRYKQIADILSGQTMADFEQITPDVSKTVFSGGTVLLVNKGKTDFVYGNMTVEGMNFKVSVEGDLP